MRTHCCRRTWRLLLVALVTATNPMASGAAAAGPPLPAWPQTFYVNALEPHGFGLPVTTAGTIAVSVHAQGAPIVVTLIRPDGRPAQQSTGTGDLSMSYIASPAEVAASPLWRISLALQQPAPGAEASGSVQVQEPPIDTRKLAAFLAQPRPPGAPPDAAARAALAKQHQAKIDATKHEFKQAHAAQQAARFEVIRPRLEAAKARAAQQVTSRGLTTPALIAPSSVHPAVTAPITNQLLPHVPTVLAPPVIDQLFVQSGEPGDVIPIAGSAFGAGGTVHFVLGPTPADDHLGTTSTWFENEIFVTIPFVTGYTAVNAFIYVVRASDGAHSKSVLFAFNPTLDLQVYPVPPQTAADSVIPNYDASWCSNQAAIYSGNPYGMVNGWAGSGSDWFPCDGAGTAFSGYKSNDIFLQTVQLRNGWLLDHADLNSFGSSDSNCSAGAYVSQADPPAVSSISPRMDVRVWADACFPYQDNHPIYSVDVYVRGPKGVPFQ